MLICFSGSLCNEKQNCFHLLNFEQIFNLIVIWFSIKLTHCIKYCHFQYCMMRYYGQHLWNSTKFVMIRNKLKCFVCTKFLKCMHTKYIFERVIPWNHIIMMTNLVLEMKIKYRTQCSIYTIVHTYTQMNFTSPRCCRDAKYLHCENPENSEKKKKSWNSNHVIHTIFPRWRFTRSENCFKTNRIILPK